jgi:hypothetical protein
MKHNIAYRSNSRMRVLAAALFFGLVFSISAGGAVLLVSFNHSGEPVSNSKRTLADKPQGAVEVAETAGPPRLELLAPSSGPLGTWVTVGGKNFTADNNFVQFRGAIFFAAGSPVRSESGSSLQFQVTSCPSRQPQCPGVFVPAGDYAVAVKNENGISNEVKFVLRAGRSE